MIKKIKESFKSANLGYWIENLAVFIMGCSFSFCLIIWTKYPQINQIIKFTILGTNFFFSLYFGIVIQLMLCIIIGCSILPPKELD